MQNFCEPRTKRLNLTLKKAIMTALDRQSALCAKQIRFLLMEWANYGAEKK